VPSLSQNLIFVSGKGGVGKTAVSRALALRLARPVGTRVLWVTFEDPAFPSGKMRVSPTLEHLNLSFLTAFDEYAQLKLGSAKVANFFSQSKLMRFLAQAAPGCRDLVERLR
jgi:anion-transporting  ArsA/GET3 family ATPase